MAGRRPCSQGPGALGANSQKLYRRQLGRIQKEWWTRPAEKVEPDDVIDFFGKVKVTFKTKTSGKAIASAGSRPVQ